ncbi:GPR39: G-protein coupled receptor 39 [Crotalus adamanteus]|uniref:GPR39: G-protein coupled receptor 39 n=1 Tax=Crotalus adamanteus TaxID=8729 RepID=A0AAW1C8B3_CROAD
MLSSKTLKNWYHFLAGLIVATLAICWLPNQVRRIMMAARPKQDWTVSYFRAYIILLPIADIFFYLSSVVNPLLYNISSQHFRKVFLQVLRCRLSIEHANKKKYLATSVNSAANINRSKRPLIFTSSRRKSSTKAAQKVSSNILQDEAEIDSSLPKQSPESLELNVRTQKVSSNILQDEAEIDSSLPNQSPESLELSVRTMPLETSIDPSLVNQNGICEHE